MSWLDALSTAVPRFLRGLQGKYTPGFYRYSLTGDLFGENTHWGLGNTVFAVKCWHILRQLNSLPAPHRQAVGDFMVSFRNPLGYIFDPLVARRAWLAEKIAALQSFRWQNFWHRQVMIAETRQALVALRLLNIALNPPTQALQASGRNIDRFFARLNWHEPWSAASHVSHLVSHLSYSDLPNKKELIDHTLQSMSRLQHVSDGAWYRGSPTRRQKVNGAMKVITALSAAGQPAFAHAERLIDLTLTVPNAADACSRLNSLYVLRHASALAPEYRLGDIRRFTQERLAFYQRYYYPQHGGFSFLPHQANITYYGARLTAGRDEPDIHGTVLFLWGISIAARLLDSSELLAFNELPV